MAVANKQQQIVLATSVILATLLYAIDATIVNVALPHIQGSLQATQDQAAWIATVYIVVSAIITPLSGWLATRFGIRRVMLVAVIGFTSCSILCGIATSMPEMILFRALQGAFGGGLIPLSQVTILQEIPRENYAKVMAVWATASMVGPVIGPTVGGYLTDALTWRWAFYINLPIGILAWMGFASAMPKSRGGTHRPFDMSGFILLSLAVGIFQLMLDRGQTNDWFNSTEIVAEAFFSGVIFYMFLVHSFTHRHPFVDIHLFKDRNFTLCMLIQGAMGAFNMSPSLLIPSFLQNLQGHTPAQAGMLMASRGAAAVVSMFVVGRLPQRFDPRYIMSLGVLTMGIAMWQMSSFSVDTPANVLVFNTCLLGLGMPMTFIPSQVIAFATLPERSRPEAGAVLRLAVNMGGSIGISTAVARLARNAQLHQSQLSELFTPYSTARWQAVGSLPGANGATGSLVDEITRQSVSIAYADDFRWLAIGGLICLPFIIMLRRSSGGGTPAKPDASSAGELAH